eukprot:scaffold1173_cov405-Prasinococcus_capsulatus_cf.AAC.6
MISSPSPAPDPAPGSAPMPAPIPAPIPIPGPSPLPAPSPGAPGPQPSPSPVASPAPLPTPGLAPEAPPAPSPTPAPQPEPQPAPQPGPQPAPQPGPQPAPQPGPQPSPQPAPQPGPLPAPLPSPQPSPQEPAPRPAPSPLSPAPVMPSPEPTPVTGPSPMPVAGPSPLEAPTPAPSPLTAPAPSSPSPEEALLPMPAPFAPGPEPAGTPFPSPTPPPETSPVPVPAPMPPPLMTPVPIPLPMPVPIPAPLRAPSPSPEPGPAPSPVPVPPAMGPTATPAPSPVPSPSAPTPDGVPSPTPIPVQQPIPVPLPLPVPRPVPLPAPEPGSGPLPSPEPSPLSPAPQPGPPSPPSPSTLPPPSQQSPSPAQQPIPLPLFEIPLPMPVPIPGIVGCTNPKAINFDPNATIDCGCCIIPGCTDPDALNFDPEATIDDGSCIFCMPGEDCDTEAPEIILLGPSTVIVEQCTPYVEPGFVVVDNVEDGLEDDVVVTFSPGGTEINTDIGGIVIAMYDVTDSAGNVAETQNRTISVQFGTSCPLPASGLLPSRHYDCYGSPLHFRSVLVPVADRLLACDELLPASTCSPNLNEFVCPGDLGVNGGAFRSVDMSLQVAEPAAEGVAQCACQGTLFQNPLTGISCPACLLIPITGASLIGIPLLSKLTCPPRAGVVPEVCTCLDAPVVAGTMETDAVEWTDTSLSPLVNELSDEFAHRGFMSRRIVTTGLTGGPEGCLQADLENISPSEALESGLASLLDVRAFVRLETSLPGARVQLLFDGAVFAETNVTEQWVQLFGRTEGVDGAIHTIEVVGLADESFTFFVDDVSLKPSSPIVLNGRMDFDIGFFEPTMFPATPVLTELSELKAFEGNFSRFVVTQDKGAGIIQVGLGSRGLALEGVFNLTAYVFVQTGVQDIPLVDILVGSQLVASVTMGGKALSPSIRMNEDLNGGLPGVSGEWVLATAIFSPDQEDAVLSFRSAVDGFLSFFVDAVSIDVVDEPPLVLNGGMEDLTSTVWMNTDPPPSSNAPTTLVAFEGDASRRVLTTSTLDRQGIVQMNLESLGLCPACAVKIELWVMVSSFDIGLALVFDVTLQVHLGNVSVGEASAAVIGQWQLISASVVAEEMEPQSLSVIAVIGNEAPSCASGEIDCTMLFFVDSVQITRT